MKINDIVAEILRLENQDDLRAVYEAYRRSVEIMGMKTVGHFVAGDKVKFARKRGGIVVGKITKINRKTINVYDEANKLNWSVAGSLIVPATENDKTTYKRRGIM